MGVIKYILFSPVDVSGMENIELVVEEVSLGVLGPRGVDVPLVVDQLGNDVWTDVHGERRSGLATFKQFRMVANLRKGKEN